MDFKVRFRKGTWDQYSSITPNDYTFYFITDLDKIYLGDVELSNAEIWDQIALINAKLDNKAALYSKTTAEWNAQASLISEKGTIYIYTDRTKIIDPDTWEVTYVPGMKIGDGTTLLKDLLFIDDPMYNHINDNSIHITPQERNFWNNKNRGYVPNQSENLILTTD